ncbi:MAG: NAD(P)H-dependent oxidoreductase [Verrucomicrobiota bacterium]
MKQLLIINASSRTNRSITRRLTEKFAAGWSTIHPNGIVKNRDLGVNPPPSISHVWIEAAYAVADGSTTISEALQLSEELIGEIEEADMIVMGVPMYNFGMPAQVKAWFDQVIRVGRTFTIDATAENPYLPLLTLKPVVAILSAGDGELHPGGAMAHLNFLEPHLATLLAFIGLVDLNVIRVGHEQYQDDRFRDSLASAENSIIAAVQKTDLAAR